MSQNFVPSRSSPGNGANPSVSGIHSPLQGGANQRAGTTDPVWSGPKGMDQSISLGSHPTKPSQRDNSLPTIPPFERGVK
jgi:hypothetical protein